MGGTLLALAVTGLRVGPHLARLRDSDFLAGVRMSGLAFPGTGLDPSRGTYLAVLFSPRCPHCALEVPRMNGWARAAGLPPLVALTSFAQDSQALATFRSQHRPLYPTLTISETAFLRLTGEHFYPRVGLVREGIVARVWEHEALPTVEELRSLMTAANDRTRSHLDG